MGKRDSARLLVLMVLAVSIAMLGMFAVGYVHGHRRAAEKPLPMRIVVYDRSRKEIVTYTGTPENASGTFYLHDASVLDAQDVSNLVE